MYEEDDEIPQRKSKAEQKREAEAAQKLGVELANLLPAKLSKLQEIVDLPTDLYRALQDYRTIKAHEARRRHMQYIGKLMRVVELEPVAQELERLHRGAQVATVQHHKLEDWRDRLLNEGEPALQDLQQLAPDIDLAHFRDLLKRAQHERKHKQPPRAARQVFRALRDLLAEQ